MLEISKALHYTKEMNYDTKYQYPTDLTVSTMNTSLDNRLVCILIKYTLWAVTPTTNISKTRLSNYAKSSIFTRL